jgi:RNA polymerase sigma-70 factor (ECF subfamily)
MTDFPETRLSLLAGIQSPENHVAWDEFVVVYRPVIYRMARRRGLQDADAQDLTQEVFIRIAKAIEHYEPRTDIRFRHWLRRVARNAIVTALARPARLAELSDQDLEHLPADTQGDAYTAEELAAEWRREQFLRAAAVVRSDVNAETWQAFELTVIQEQSCEAAATALGKSVGTIYAARSRIMKRLREQIERHLGEEA